MSETKPRIKKVSEDGGTEWFRRHQAKSRKFISRKENPVGKSENIKNTAFDLVPQGDTNLFTHSLKTFYYICGVKFQKNGSNVQYAIKNILDTMLSAPTDTAFEAGKTALTMVQKKILDAKIKK